MNDKKIRKDRRAHPWLTQDWPYGAFLHGTK